MRVKAPSLNPNSHISPLTELLTEDQSRETTSRLWVRNIKS